MARYRGVIKFRGNKYRIFGHFYTESGAKAKQDQLRKDGKPAIVRKHTEKRSVLWLVYTRDRR